MQTDRKIIVVSRQTRLQHLITRYNTIQQAKFQTEYLGLSFEDFLLEDQHYHSVLNEVNQQSQSFGRVQGLERSFLPNFIFPPDCWVVVVGQDGLVANTLKYLENQPIIGVNPDPKRWDGVLLPFQAADISRVFSDLLKKRRTLKEITMASAELSDGQQLRAVNDIFIGVRGHSSARYQIQMGEHQENHSSSGIIISTGLGSTGWLRSILTGSMAMLEKLNNSDNKNNDNKRKSSFKQQLQNNNSIFENILQNGLPWNTQNLIYSVREPYPSRNTQTQLVFGDITPQNPLLIRSLMPENGIIFSDGMESDGLEFRSGLQATIGICPQKGYLVI